MLLSRWCHPTISSSVIPFSSCLQCFPASRSFLMSRLFALGGQNIGGSASASVLPVNIHNLFPLGLTGLILKSKGLSRVSQFFSAKPFLWSNSHIHTWILESQFSHSVVSDSMRPYRLQQARLPCPSPTPGSCSTHVRWVGDAIQPSHPPSSSSPPAFNVSQHQGLF